MKMRNMVAILSVSWFLCACTKPDAHHYFDATYSNKEGSITLSILFSHDGTVKFASRAVQSHGLDQVGTYRVDGSLITLDFSNQGQVFKQDGDALIAVSGPFPQGFKFVKE